jgi:hypothetical protein
VHVMWGLHSSVAGDLNLLGCGAGSPAE